MVVGEEEIPPTMVVSEASICRFGEVLRKVKNLTDYGIWRLCRQHFRIAIPAKAPILQFWSTQELDLSC